MDTNSLNSFLDYLRIEKGASPNTVSAYRRDLTRYLKWSEQGKNIKEYAASLDDLQPASRERNFSAVRSFHSYLSRELNIEDPTGDLPENSQKLRLPKALTIDQMVGMIEGAKQNTMLSLRDYALLELLYSTGGRVSEVVGINLNDFQRGDELSVIKLRGKGGKERLVPIGTYAINAVDDYLVRCRPALSKGKSDTALFLNARGTRLSRQSAWEIVKEAAERANLSLHVTPHVFRHSFATHLLDGGADIRVVQELLGHSSVTTTQIYTLVTIDKVRETYRLAHPRAN